MFEKMSKSSLLLTLFAIATAGLISVIYSLTQNKIAQQVAWQKQQLFDQVLPPSHYDNNLLDDCYVVTDLALGNAYPHRLYLAKKQQQITGVIIENIASDGYAGNIHLLIATDLQGTVQGVRVTEHHETPGLGDRIELAVSDWITHFSGKRVTGKDDPYWRVKKEGGGFDQFTGATITPRAIVKSVKLTAHYVTQHDMNQLALTTRCRSAL